MFWPKIRVVLLSGLLVLTWVLASQAEPISFTSTDYYAYANVYDNSNPEGLVDEESGSSTPISASILITTASAGAGIPDASSLYANASATSSDGYAEAHAAANLYFTASFPQIRIQYNYDVSLAGDASGGFSVYLHDDGGGNTPIQIFSGNGSGSFDQNFPLYVDHDYRLSLTTDFLSAYPGDSASVSLTNIDIQAVPLPPSLFLLGSGLLGLWSWRRGHPY